VSFGLDFFKNYAGFQSMSLSSVYAAIELISNSVASLPIHIKDKKSGEIIDHPIQEIFNNSMVSKFILVKQLIVDMLLSGNGIAYIQR
jgi:phage portal protein BeeE